MMLLPRAVRIYVATAPCNLRRSFEGLTNEVRATLEMDPLNGHVFVFLNRRRTMVKLLVWTRGGFTIVHKRLERGTFTFPSQAQPGVKRRVGRPRVSDAAGGHRHLQDTKLPRWEPPAQVRVA
jgi:transposase